MDINFFLKKYNIHHILAFIYFFLNKYRIIKLYKPIFNDKKNKNTVIEIIKAPNKTYNQIPNTIWMYWDSEPTQNIRSFSEKIKINNPEWQVNVITRKTLNDFLPSFQIENLDMPLANITDLIRLELLYQYGGVWLDHSIILTQKLDFFLAIENIKTFDVIAYYREISTINWQFPAMESWFLAAPANSEFIKLCLQEFNAVKKIGSKKFYQKLQNRNDFSEIKQNITPPEYLIVYLIFQIVMQKYNVNLHLKSSDQSAFIVQDFYGWRSHKSSIYFFMQDAPSNPSPIYKLTSGDRQYLNILIKYNFLNKNSLIGQLLKLKHN